MSPGQCSCPECGTILRIRDRSFIGRQVDCPDCHAKLLIRIDDERKIVAENQQPGHASKPPTLHVTSALVKFGPMLQKRILRYVHSPLVLAWLLAVSLTAFIAILMLRPAVRLRSHAGSTSARVVETPDVASTDKRPDAPSGEMPVSNPDASAHSEEKAAASQKIEKPVSVATLPTPEKTDHPPTIEKPATDVSVAPPVDHNPPPGRPVREKIDVEELMKQRLLKFATDKPNTREQILDQLEELLGIPIRFDREELGEKNLQRVISINLESTTVGGVLKVLLEQSNWEYSIEDQGLRLKCRQTAGPVRE